MFVQYASKYAQKLGLVFLLCFVFSKAAYAADAVILSGEQTAAYGRILIAWPDTQIGPDLTLDAQIKNGVLVARFNQTFSADAKPLLADLKDIAALARLDQDQRTLRIALKGPREVKTSRSYNVFVIDLVAPGSDIVPPKFLSDQEKQKNARDAAQKQDALDQAAAAAELQKPGPAIPLRVRASQTNDYTRISFDWTKPVGHTLTNQGSVAQITFDKPASPDLAPLKANALRGLLNADSRVDGHKTIVSLDLAPNVKARLWQDGTNVLVDLFESSKPPAPAISDAQAANALATKDAPEAAKPQTPASAQTAHAEDTAIEDHIDISSDDLAAEPLTEAAIAIDPTPIGGVVHAKAARTGPDLRVTFTYAAPVGSAAFRRGDSIWILFDDNAKIDLSELQRDASQHIRGYKTFNTGTAGGVRFEVPPSTQIEAQVSNGGAQWLFAFAEKRAATPKELKLHREADGSGPGKLIGDLQNVTAIHTVKDPVIGDHISIATALGPVTGIQSTQRFVEVTALPSAHGLAFEISADGVRFNKRKDQVVVETGRGLSLTPSARPTQINPNNRAHSSIALPSLTATPGFIDFVTWSAPAREHGFNTAYDEQIRLLSEDETDPQARIAVARFLVANELAPEALGMLSLARQLDPMLVHDAQFRAVRGIANLQLGRIKDARADFAAQTLNNDPSAALWRGYLAAEMEDWAPARREFDAGRDAFYLYTPEWQVRLRNAYARSALALNDLGATKRQLDEAMALDSELGTRLRTRLIRAAYAEARGDNDEAIRLYQSVADGGYEPLEAQALFEKIRLQTRIGILTPTEAADLLENLRYRWRGDNLELEQVLALGGIYGEKGDYRRALKAMNTAVIRFPNSPVTRRISDDMYQIFNDLFLKGGADSMDPIQALALFYQFIDLVPIGAEGDRMLRRLADRLIDFDLLPQATELLQHQVDNRIRNGQARAQIAAKLALIYLMDRKPEKALAAIRTTRQARLPKALNQERRLIEARALMVLGRSNHALELIETDRTQAAALLRADIAWQSKEWAMAGPLMLRTVQRHVAFGNELSEEDSALILRTAIALSLSNDGVGLKTLADQYADMMDQSIEKETFALVTRQDNLGNIPVKELAPILAKAEDLRAVLKKYQERFDTPAANPQNANTTTADAAGSTGGAP